ncbi:MAG TPA: UDP-N-acetylmuramoyl-L-alanyl-D-glutamate--2,6-diaminopimelate ligase [Acidimicrobiales bacterium]|nr:UDP-N-acetylmuramoyl-L-alanyl-D-glutamate--2,6-diaminopimelate ligase [Acidimicrobiales bacterium]
MRLDRLLDELEVVDVQGQATGVEVTSVGHDSRLVEPGSLFCALPGRHGDGHDHAAEAAARGAAAVLAARPVDVDVPVVVVEDTRRQMGRAAAAFWGHPSRRLPVVGVTGTNGKTTTTWFLHAILEAAGRSTGVIGTLSGPLTTPESPDLQACLAGMVTAGRAAVAMEVSSHALAQARVEGVHFAVAVFTNLSRDHLDFHPSMEDYFSVKARLFEPERSAAAVVNVDDPHGRLLLETARIPTRTYSLDDVSVVSTGLAGSRFTWRGREVHVRLGGLANVANALAAGSAALELGLDEDAVAAGLAGAGPVPGRYQLIDRGQPFTAVVDYAHTPGALEQLLVAARAETRGRVVVVFGCGGDRDRDKRPLMGRVAAAMADVVVVTSDNARAEDPAAVIAEVVAGARGPGEVSVEPDRRQAIALAVGAARPGDVVLVAGKGHETTQTVGGRQVDFDDREVVGQALVALGFDHDPSA